MINFIINNLAVLLVLQALVGILGFYWVCHKAAQMERQLKTVRLNSCGDPYDPDAMSYYKSQKQS